MRICWWVELSSNINQKEKIMNTRKDIEASLDDTRVTLLPTLDMNIYTNDDGTIRFSIYPVSDGITLVQTALATGILKINYEENN